MNIEDSSQENIDDISEVENTVAENERLREVNQQLQTQNDELNRQFETAVESIQKMEAVNKQNALLMAQINELKAQNEELNQRIKICDDTKAELNSKVQGAISRVEREYQDEISQLQAQVLSLQSQRKIESEKLQLKLQSSEEASIKAQTENAVYQNQIGKILKLSENFFHQKVEDVKQLIDLLMHPLPMNNDAVQQSATSILNEQDKKKLKQTKSLLDKEKARCKQLELEVIQLRQASQAESAKFSSQINEFQDTIRRLQNKNSQLENEHKQEVLDLQKKLNATKKMHSVMIQTNELELGGNPLLDSASQEIDSLKTQLQKADNDFKQQQAQIDDLTKQVQDGEAIKEKLRKRAQKVLDKNEQLLKDLNNSERTISALNEKLEQSHEEKEQLSNQLQLYKMSKDDINSQQEKSIKDLGNTQKALDMLEQLMSEQSEELAKIVNDRDRLLSIVHTQNQSLLSTEAIIDNLQNDYKSEGQHTIVMQNEVHVNGSDWDFGTLPDDLKSILKGIAENDGFSVEKRVSQIFSVVSRWFGNHEAESKNAISELTEKVENGNKTLSDFASSLLHAIDRDSLDLNEIVEAVSAIYKENFVLQQKVNELKSIPEVCDQQTFDEMTKTIEALQQAVKILRNKNTQKKAELHECKEAFITVKNKADEELEIMRESNEKARETIQQLQEQIDSLNKHNKELLVEIDDTKIVHSKDYNAAQNKIDSILMEQSSKYDEMTYEYQKEIKARDEQIASLQNKIKEFESSLKKWEDSSRNASEETRKVKVQLNQVMIESDSKYNQMLHQKEKEARQIEDNYQSMIEQLKVKSEETEAIVQSMSKGIEDYEQRMKQMTQQVSQLNFQLQKSDMKAQSQIDSIERSKKLAIAQLKAQLMAVETKYSVIADEQRHKWEAEKRNLFCFFAQQFGSFFDAKQSLNEDSFKIIVNRIKNEIEKHKKQEQTIRKLLKARESQSTEDALADLVLSLHPQLQQKTPISSY
ncbi:hypothetical protein M9Y10_034736 [Tritrichomonas musculus]|uniref:Viral A-type inclusion protein n=1 Tax=Tritrichomonas musculus TaxID=1915356 RepID=A0ABR2KFS5_9EUKA